MTRKEIREKIDTNNKLIKNLKDQNKKLIIEDYKISDSTQWYKEGIEDKIIKKRPKITKQVNRGRVYWIELFTDENTGRQIPIERNKVVMEDGFWYY